MYALTIGLAIETPELRDEVQTTLQGLPLQVVFNQASIGDRPAFLDRIERLRPDVVLVDVTHLANCVEDVIGEINSTDAEPMVIALNASADPEMILRTLRAGANEYLYPPLQATLHKALERKSSERARHRDSVRGRGKILGFLSVKGGCGATTIACHVAAHLGRQADKVTLLADLDLDLGLVGFLMKSKSAYSLLDAVNNLHRLDLSYWKALVSNGVPGLEIMPAPATLANRQLPDAQSLEHVFSFIRSNYDWAVADLGRGLSRQTLGLLEQMDETCVVTTLEIPALHQAKQMIQDLLNRNVGRNRLHLVLNRIPARPEVGDGELEQMLGLPVHAALPNDYHALYESYSEGKLLPVNSRLSKHLARLAEKLAGIQEGKNRHKFLFFRAGE
jgi:pilus assembly protein CpaE